MSAGEEVSMHLVPASLPALHTEELRGHVVMTNEAYHAAPGYSKSHLDEIADDRAPLHYWAAYRDPNRIPREPTPALELGNAIHSAILEPLDFTDRYAIAPDVDRRTKEGKAVYRDFMASSIGKTPLTASQYETCVGMIEAVYSHPVAAGLLTGGVAEQSHFALDEETGALIKCRIDYLLGSLDGGMIVDFKSCENASPRAFARAAELYRYDVAPAWYYHVINMGYRVRPSQWVWIGCEKEHPYAIIIRYATQAAIDAAFVVAREDFHLILECDRNNHWPDYGEEILPLEIRPRVSRRLSHVRR